LRRAIAYNEKWANHDKVIDWKRAEHAHKAAHYRNELKMLEDIMAQPSNYRT
jgi:hypothetical protein